MNKIASLLSVQSTGPRSYPELSSFHNHCTVSIHFNDLTCQSAFNQNKDDIEMWHPDHSGSGTYELYDAVEEEQIWTARHSKVKQTNHKQISGVMPFIFEVMTENKSDLIDDVMFQYYPDTGDFRDAGCTIGAKS